MLCAGDSYSAGSTGGEASHTLTVSEMPSHNHQVTGVVLTDAGSTVVPSGSYYSFTQGTRGSNYTGGSAAHNNMPPYRVVYCWERTA